MRLGIYREDGMKSLVEVVADNSDDEWERYDLRIVKVLRQSPIMVDVHEGEKFSVNGKRDSFYGGVWALEENTEYAKEIIEEWHRKAGKI